MLFFFAFIGTRKKNVSLIRPLSLSLMEDQSLFADRPEWADVVPLEQYEGINPIAPIFYTPECACIQ